MGRESLDDYGQDSAALTEGIQRENLGMTIDEARGEIEYYQRHFPGPKKIGKSRVETMRRAAEIYKDTMESGDRDSDPEIAQAIEEILKKTA